MLRSKWLAGTLILASVAAIYMIAFAQGSNQPVPTLVNYQGRLARADGTVVPNNTYSLKFSLWTKLSPSDPNGLKKWEETQNVVVRNGVFSVLLGSSSGLNESLFSTPMFLETQIGTDPPLTPRQPLATAPYAFRAEVSRKTLSVNDGAITTSKLANGAVTESKLADNAAGTAKIANGAVTQDKLGANSVSSGKLASDADSFEKVSGGAATIQGGSLNLGQDLKVASGKALYFGGIGGGTGLWDDTGGQRTVIRALGDRLDIVNQANSAHLAKLTTGTIEWPGAGSIVSYDSKIHMQALQDIFLNPWGGGRIFVGGTGVELWQRMYINNHGFNGSPSIDLAIGDTDTGFNWVGDGAFDIMANHVKVAEVRPDRFTVTAAGKTFKIDHPLDPDNRYLYHSCVESPDMMNVYNGVVKCDTRGNALVELPGYFEALNKDFRYQLTCVGGYAPVYVSKEVRGNRFEIAGGKPGLKVSWQVTGVRNDTVAKANRVVPEVEKPTEEKGRRLYEPHR